MQDRVLTFHKEFYEDIGIKHMIACSNDEKRMLFRFKMKSSNAFGTLKAVTILENEGSFDSLSSNEKIQYEEIISNLYKKYDKLLKRQAKQEEEDVFCYCPIKVTEEVLLQKSKNYREENNSIPYITYRYNLWKEERRYGVDLYIYQMEDISLNYIDSEYPIKRQGTLMEGSKSDTNVFGRYISKKSIKQIVFSSDLKTKSAPANAWDVSVEQNRSIMAWIKNDILYISSYDKIIANPSCKYLFYEYNNVTNIDFENCFDTSNVTDMRNMFSGCSSLTSIDVSHFDTSNVTNMIHMFDGCFSLVSIDVSHFDTSNVIDMSYMFNLCLNLTNIDVSHFDTSSVTNMNDMFGICPKLTSIDVSHFDTSNVTDMSYMFSGCASLASIDVSHFDTSNVTDMRCMFSGCTSLTSIDVSHFDTSNVTNMILMFDGCCSLTNIDVSYFDTTSVEEILEKYSDKTK